MSILMLSAEEDIDGNEPVQQVQPAVRKVEAKKSVSEKKSDEKVVARPLVFSCP